VKVCLCSVGDSCPEVGCCNDTMVEVVQFLHKHISAEVSHHWFFNVLLTVCLAIIFVNSQLHVQFFFMYISIRYMFRAAVCPSSGELIVSI
jgi:hypothetical protein